MNISIGTLSKAFELSDEALRFYEKKGLLQPIRREGSRYRLYEQTDIQRVANIKRMKSMGFSLEEVQRVYSGCQEGELLEMYRSKLESIQLEIDRLHSLAEHIDRTISTVLTAPDLLLRPQLIRIADVRLMEYPSIPDMWADIPENPALKTMFQMMPLTSFTTIISPEALQGKECPSRKGILFLERNARVVGVGKENMKKISAGPAVSCMFRLENGCFDIRALIGILAEFIEKNNLKPRDEIYSDQLMSYVNEEGNAVHYSRLILPVE